MDSWGRPGLRQSVLLEKEARLQGCEEANLSFH